MSLAKKLIASRRESVARVGAVLATVYPPDAAGDRQLEQTLERLRQLPGVGQQSPSQGA